MSVPGSRDPRPAMVNFFNPGAGAGVSPDGGPRSIGRRGESLRYASTMAKGGMPGATASRGRVTPSMLVFLGLRTRIPVGVRGGQIHDQRDRRHRLVRQAPDAEAADFEHAGQRRGRTHQQAAGAGLDMKRGRPPPAARRAARLARPPAAAPRPIAICRSRLARGSARPSGRRERRRRGWWSFLSPTCVLNPFIPAKAGIEP